MSLVDSESRHHMRTNPSKNGRWLTSEKAKAQKPTDTHVK
jgi:hypothetical protein